MKKALVAYASKYGSTAHVAEWIGASMDWDVDVKNVEDVSDLSYGFIVLGSPIYNERPLDEMEQFVQRHTQTLVQKPKAIFVVTTDTESEAKNQRNLEAMKQMVPGAIVDQAIFAGEVDLIELSSQDQEQIGEYLNTIGEPKEGFRFLNEEKCRAFGRSLNQYIRA